MSDVNSSPISSRPSFNAPDKILVLLILLNESTINFSASKIHLAACLCVGLVPIWMFFNT
jgi:hypothetical protein